MSSEKIITDSPAPDYGNLSADPSQEPPKYDDVPAETPPSYSSLFGEIKQAKQESSGVAEFLKNFVKIFLSTIGCSIFIALLLALPIASIVIGAKYLHQCPIQSKIPIYLIVMGAFGIVRNLIGLFNQRKRRAGNSESDNRKGFFEGIIDCFLIAWFIAGNVWIYSNFQPDYDHPSSPHYCHKTLYLFAFGLTTAAYVFVLTICCLMCCVMVCAAVIK